MASKRQKPTARGNPRPTEPRSTEPVGVRIIGGRFRGRRLEYSGDLLTRPMKDRVREALFNLLGPSVVGKVAIDLFAGTGALGLEALSRGSLRAIFMERHLPTTQTLRRNAATLGVEASIEVIPGNTFLWAQRLTVPDPVPWIVFCSPPYDLYVEQKEDMLGLIDRLIEASPSGSSFVVEADERFDFSELPHAGEWDVRDYPPAFVGIWRKQEV